MSSGPQTLLLLPGWGMGPDCWGAFGAALEERFSVVRESLPGHGVAPARADWTLASEADRLLALAPDAHWLAWSLGAQVALTAAMRSPGRLRRLVLLGATPRFRAAHDWSEGMPNSDLEAFRSNCTDNPAATLRRFHALQVRGSDHAAETVRALRQSQLPDPSAAVLSAGLDRLAETDLRASLGAIESPCLWLSGERDAITPAGAARKASRAMPRAHVSCVPGAGHAPFLSHADATLAQVLDFLDEPQS